MAFRSYILLMVVCIACQVVFQSCGARHDTSTTKPYKNTKEYPPVNHNVGKESQWEEKFPSPYSEEIEKVIEENSWCGTRKVGLSENGTGAEIQCFRDILKDAPFEKLIPFINHRAEYVRSVAHELLLEKKYQWKNEISGTFKNGDARIKLGLLDFVEPKASSEKRFGLLDQIIQTSRLRVYRSDLKHLNKTKFFIEKPVKKPAKPRSDMVRNMFQDHENIIYAVDINEQYKPDFFKGLFLDKKKDLKPEDYPFDIIGFYSRLLEDHYEVDRGYALNQLEYFGPDAKRAVPAILELMKLDDVPAVCSDGISIHTHTQRALCSIALGKIGLKDENVITELRNYREEKPDVSCFVAYALRQLDDNKQGQCDYLLNMLDDKNNSSYRPWIIESMGLIGPDMKIATPIIEKLSTCEDDKIRWLSNTALSSIEGANSKVIRSLVNLKNDNPDVRSYSINNLWRETDSPKVKDSLYELLKTETSAKVLLNVCSSIEFHDKTADKNKLLDAYIRILEAKDRDYSSCSHAVDQIHKMGISAKKAVPSLLNIVGNTEYNDMDSTYETIIAVGGDYESVVNKLLVAPKTNSFYIGKYYYLIAKAGSHAIDAIPVLYDEYLEAIEIKKATNRYNKYFDSDEPACGAIISILNSSMIDKKDVPSEYLIPILSNSNTRLADLAFQILREQGTCDTIILDELVRQLNNGDADVKKETIRRIGEMGEKALPLVPLLRKQPENETACNAISVLLLSLEKGKKYDDKMLLECLPSYFGIEQRHVDKLLELGVPEDKIILKVGEIAKVHYGNSDSSPIYFLSRLGEKASIALPLIREAYTSKDYSQFNFNPHKIVKILNAIEPTSKVTIQNILAMMECDIEMIIDASIEAVLRKGGTWDDIAIQLAKNITSDNKEIRCTTEERIFYKYPDKLTSALLVLKDFDFSNVNKWQIRNTVDNAIDRLLHSVNDKSSISPDDILVFMDLGSDSHKFAAADAVARITGNYDKPAIKLAQLSSSKNKETREYCIGALGLLGGNAKAALPILKNIKPIDENHKMLLDANIALIETGEIRPVDYVAEHHSGLILPSRYERRPYGVLSVDYLAKNNMPVVSHSQLQVDINMPEGDDENRIYKFANWKFKYKDGSKFPDIADIHKNSRNYPSNWILTFREDFIPLKDATVTIALPDGEYSPEYKFMTPPDSNSQSFSGMGRNVVGERDP